MLWVRISATVVTLSLGAYTADQVYDILKPEATVAAAQQTFDNVADAAYMERMLVTETWPETLQRVADESRHGDALTVEGTTMYWRTEEDCFTASVPTPETEPEAVPCG